MSGALAACWAAWTLWLLAPWRARVRSPAGDAGAARGRTWRRRRSAVAVVAAVLGGVAIGGAWAAATVAAVLWAGGRWRRMQRRRLDARRAAACVPDLGELLRIGIAAGLTPVLALEQLADVAPGPGRAAAAAVRDATARGQRFGDALALLEVHLGPSARPLVDALAATDRYGVPLEPVLDAALADLRRRRRTEAGEAARRLPVTLSFPLVGCVLPAFALLTLAPLLAGAFGSLRADTGSGTGARPGTTESPLAGLAPAVGAPGASPGAAGARSQRTDAGGPDHATTVPDPLAAAERAATRPPP